MYSELALESITLNLLESDVYHIKVSDHIMRKDLKKKLCLKMVLGVAYFAFGYFCL